MAIPTQAELAAIDAANGGTASAPLTQDQQAIRSLGQTQSTSQQAPTGPIPYDAPVFQQSQVNQDLTSTSSSQAPTAANTQGKGAPSEDAGTKTAASMTTSVNTAGNLNSGVSSQPNALDKYGSYTYSLSWYMLTVAQKTALSAQSIIDVSGWSLLMQSGGAAPAGRNKYFYLDYYMDNLIIESAFNNNGMSTVSELSFTVSEPNGITLIPNLNKAATDLYASTKVSPKDAFYIMVIKFYGYDSAGKQTPCVGPNNKPIIKYFPFNIANIEFKAASRAVEYQVKGVPLNDIIGKGSALGSIPQPFQLVGETVDDILNGKQGKVAVAADTNDRGATNQASPNQGSTKNASPATSLSSVATGQDNPLATSGGMDFTAGNF